jgi:hypothetical protein
MLCDAFLKADGPGDYAAGSLDTLRALLATARLSYRAEDIDASVRELVLGRPRTVAFEWAGNSYSIDPVKSRYEEYQQLLDIQKVTPLQALFSIYNNITLLSAGKADSLGEEQAIAEALNRIPESPNGTKYRPEGKERENLESLDLRKARAALLELRQKTAKKKRNAEEIQRLCRQLLAAINPQVKLALSGVIYAYYLRPTDLLVAEDPLFLRKHQFKPLLDADRSGMFTESNLRVNSTGLGSYFEGGFATFSEAAGRAAAASTRTDSHAEAVVTDQIGAIRATSWNRLNDTDLRLLGLKARLGREWILQSATIPAARASLAEATLGLLSRARRADLLNGIDSRNWEAVWKCVSLSDLYFLTNRYLARTRKDLWQSPVTIALRETLQRTPTSNLDLLGANLPALFECDHPHLVFAAPYEEYERDLLPDKLAERVSEFKLYLADFADREGLPASALAQIAEPVARKVLKGVTMSDEHDWPAVLAALAAVNDAAVKAALE